MIQMVWFMALLAFMLAVMVGGIPSGAVIAKGGGTKPGEVRQKALLAPSAGGGGMGALGQAEVKVVGAKQEFEVFMNALGADGQTLSIYVTSSAHPGQELLAGEMVIQTGVGLLALSNEHGAAPPDGILPVLGIQTVTVRDATRQVVLQGGF